MQEYDDSVLLTWSGWIIRHKDSYIVFKMTKVNCIKFLKALLNKIYMHDDNMTSTSCLNHTTKEYCNYCNCIFNCFRKNPAPEKPDTKLIFHEIIISMCTDTTSKHGSE